MLTEAVKENPNWGRLGIEYAPPKATEPTSSYVCVLFVSLFYSIYFCANCVS